MFGREHCTEIDCVACTPRSAFFVAVERGEKLQWKLWIWKGSSPSVSPKGRSSQRHRDNVQTVTITSQANKIRPIGV